MWWSLIQPHTPTPYKKIPLWSVLKQHSRHLHTLYSKSGSSKHTQKASRAITEAEKGRARERCSHQALPDQAPPFWRSWSPCEAESLKVPSSSSPSTSHSLKKWSLPVVRTLIAHRVYTVSSVLSSTTPHMTSMSSAYLALKWNLFSPKQAYSGIKAACLASLRLPEQILGENAHGLKHVLGSREEQE